MKKHVTNALHTQLVRCVSIFQFQINAVTKDVRVIHLLEGPLSALVCHPIGNPFGTSSYIVAVFAGEGWNLNGRRAETTWRFSVET